MARVRITADVDEALRRRVKIAAVSSDRSVSEWVESAVRRELEREERGPALTAEDEGSTWERAS